MLGERRCNCHVSVWESRPTAISRAKKRKQASRIVADLRIYGANDRIRTGDLRITSALLYQLSHVGNNLGFPKQTRV